MPTGSIANSPRQRNHRVRLRYTAQPYGYAIAQKRHRFVTPPGYPLVDIAVY